jgi:hypothetical protein
MASLSIRYFKSWAKSGRKGQHRSAGREQHSKTNSTRTAVPSHYCKHRMGTDQPLSVDL